MRLAEYVILPSRGIRVASSTARTARLYLVGLVPGRRAPVANLSMEVLDTIGSDGARLVRASRRALDDLRAAHPGLVVAPVCYYQPASWQAGMIDKLARLRAVTGTVSLTVRSRTTGKPVPGADVIAVVDAASNLGTVARTNAGGVARLRLGGRTTIERLFVFAAGGYWSRMARDVEIVDPFVVTLRPLAIDAVDGLHHHLRPGKAHDGAGVRVGVVDTGVSRTHPDLVVVGGRNTVTGEADDDFGDNGDGHGTHVAGIIAAHGRLPTGRRGVAPGADVYSYRVFPRRGRSGAANFAIAKAIDAAVQDRCDVINLSLGSGEPDPVLRAAIEDARAAGTVVIAAAGNDDRDAVAFPASETTAIGVSALGRKGTYPGDSTAIADQRGPYGRDRADYVAAFSNVGPQIDLTGPGVAIISTVPGGYGEMSGTSMACPAVAGMTARLLGRTPKLLAAARDQDRSDEIIRRLLTRTRSLGLPPDLEGRGLPR